MHSAAFIFLWRRGKASDNKDDAIRVFYVDFRIQLSGSCGMAAGQGGNACLDGCLSHHLPHRLTALGTGATYMEIVKSGKVGGRR